MFKYKQEEELQKMTVEERNQYATDKRAFEAEESRKAINVAVEPLNKSIETVTKSVSEIQESVSQLKEIGLTPKVTVDNFEDSFKVQISESIKADFASVSKVGNGTKQHSLTTKVVGGMTGAANITPASGIVQTYRNGVAIAPNRLSHFRDFVRAVQSATGQYVFYRENTPPGEGAFAFQTSHLATKAQLDYERFKVTVNLEYLAGFATVARQMMEDLPWLQSALPDELLRDFYNQEDTEFYTLIAAAATAGVSTATPVAERIIDFVTQVETLDYSVSAIAIHPKDWGNVRALPTNGSYSVPGGFSINPTNGGISIAGIPLIKATWVPVDKVIVADWSRAEIVQASGLNLDFSYENASNFVQNAVTAKVEQREGLAILRPNAFVLGDLGLLP